MHPSMRSTIRIPPGTLSKKKSKDVSFPDSPAIVRTAEGMSLFRTADEELDIEESNVENRLREFTLEDPDEFVDPDSEEETALTGDKRKPCVSIRMYFARQTDTESTGTARAGNDLENGPDGHLLLGNGGLTCGGRLCNVTSLSATAIPHCNTLRPTLVTHLRLPLLDRCSHKPYKHRNLDGNDGGKPQRKIPVLPTRHFLD
jgi:hypothetical protein